MTLALLTSWDFRLIVIIGLAIPGFFYVRGWRYLRTVTRSSQDEPVAPTARPWWPVGSPPHSRWSGSNRVADVAGDVLGGQLFFMHTIQHLLMIMIAAPLSVGNPFPVLVWGLPPRAADSRRPAEWSITFSVAITKITSPGIVWLLFFTVYVGWHDPNLYDLARCAANSSTISNISRSSLPTCCSGGGMSPASRPFPPHSVHLPAPGLRACRLSPPT